jgi:hypothetical protein
LILGKPQQPSTETPPGEIRGNHQTTDLPRIVLLARTNRADESAVKANAPCRPNIDPGSYIVKGLVEGWNVEGVVGKGLIDPAAPL